MGFKYSASQKKCPLAKCNDWGPLELNCNIPYTYKGYLGMPRYYRIRFVVPTVWSTASTSLSVQAPSPLHHPSITPRSPLHRPSINPPSPLDHPSITPPSVMESITPPSPLHRHSIAPPSPLHHPRGLQHPFSISRRFKCSFHISALTGVKEAEA